MFAWSKPRCRLSMGSCAKKRFVILPPMASGREKCVWQRARMSATSHSHFTTTTRSLDPAQSERFSNCGMLTPMKSDDAGDLGRAHKASAAKVRPFRLADYDEVLRVWKRTEGVGLNESDTRPAIATFLRRNPGLSFVAVKQGRIVGAVLCGHDGRRGYLHHLAVAKRHRKQGVGLRLVNACLAKLRASGIHKCNLFVFAGHAAGMSFWKHHGWKLRADLRVMQVQLRHQASASLECGC